MNIPKRKNSHGHVFPRIDGGRMRCGGPALCKVCAAEYREAMLAGYDVSHIPTPKKEKPTMSAVTNFDDYQRATVETAIYPHVGDGYGPELDGLIGVHVAALSYLGLGLSEVGEVQGKIKKLIRDGGYTSETAPYVEITASQREEILSECGDALWYITQLAAFLQSELSHVAQMNIDKLRSRKDRGVIGGSGDNR